MHQKSKKYIQNVILQHQQLKKMSNSFAFTIWLYLVTFTVLFVMIIIFAIITNLAVLAATSGAFYITLVIDEQWQICATAIRESNTPKIEDCVAIISPLEKLTIMFLTLMQFGIAVWDLCLGVIQIVILLLIEVGMAAFKFIFGTILREPAIALANIAVQIFQVLVNAMNGAMDGLGTDGVGASFGASKGLGASETTLGEGSPDGGVVQFIVFFIQVIVVRGVKWLEHVGMDIFKIIDFIFITGKWIPKMVQTLMNVVDMLNITKGVGKFLFKIFDMLNVFEEVNYGFCTSIRGLVSLTCTVWNVIAALSNSVRSALNSLCANSCKLWDKMDGCNPSDLIGGFCKPPDRGTGLGLGLCDTEACVFDVLDIIDVVESQMPTCNFWQSNSSSVTQCMNLVSNYSLYNTKVTTRAPIGTISQEICFVLVTTIVSQCSQSQPPFGFSFETVATDICINDKSGLVPPLETFSERCACVYQTPLCPYDCCDQYSRHVIGQIKDTIGGIQCASILVQYPESFWCPFSGLNATETPRMADYTFPAVWCSAYKRYIKPICTGYPFHLLNAIPTIGSDFFLADYLNSTCVSISNQTGVCIPINATIEPDILFLQGQQPDLDAEIDIFLENNEATFTPHFIENTITESTPVENVARIYVDKFPCAFLSQIYNNTSLKYNTEKDTVNATIALFCDMEIRTAYRAFTLRRFTDFITITKDGTPIPVQLEGIPSGVQVFNSDSLGASSTSSATTATFGIAPNSCPTVTGSTVQETSQQIKCTEQVQANSVDALTAAEDDASEAESTMETNTVIADPMIHMSTFESGNLDPSDPNYAAKTEDVNSLNEAQKVDTNIQFGNSANDEPTTKTYAVYNEKPPTSDSNLKDMPLYVNYDKKGNRKLLSIDDEWDKQVNLLKSSFLSLKKSVEIMMAHMNTPNENNPTEREMQKLKEAAAADFRDIELGKVTVGSKYFMRRTRKILADRNILSYSSSRKLMTTTGDLELDEKINEKFLEMARANATYPGISQTDFEVLVNEKNSADIVVIGTILRDIVIPSVFNTFFGFMEEGADFTFGATESADPNCKNTISQPYTCCQPDISPYTCCQGLIGCIPLLAEYLFPIITTVENAARWLCEKFDSMGEYYINSLRVFVTAGVYVFESAAGPLAGPASFFLDPITYKDNEVPDNSVGCMVVQSKYAVGLILAMVFLYTIVSTMAVTGILMMLKDKFNELKTSRESLALHSID